MSTYTAKFEKFMLGDKVRINTNPEFGDVIPMSNAITLLRFYMELINDSYNPETFKNKHSWCEPSDMKKFRYRCTLLLFDVIMSCEEMLDNDGFLASTINKVSKALSLSIPESHDIPVMISDSKGNWVESTSDYAICKMYFNLMKFQKQRKIAASTRTRTRTYGNMTLRPLTIRS